MNAGYLIKAPPQRVGIGERMIAIERAFFGGEGAARGAAAFVWFTETKGGAGLAFSGNIHSAGSMHEVHARRMRVAVDVRHVAAGLADADLAPYFDDLSGEPMATLAQKLCRHAHDKVCGLSAAEVGLLNTFIEASA